MRAGVLLMSLLLLGCAAPRLATVDPARLDALLDEAIAGSGAPSVSVSIATATGERATWTRGVADLATGREATGETRYPWFSATKIATATAVMQLVEQGLVDLDAPASRYLPGLARLRNPYGTEITVRHLLSHSSGLANPIPVAWIHPADEPGPSLAALTRRLLEENDRLQFEPGSRASYSNLGYLVLGGIVERVSGMRFEAYVHRHILDPLGMRSTGFAWPGAGAATGYSRRWSFMGVAGRFLIDGRFFGATHDGRTEIRPFLVDGAPYGGLIGTTADMARFLEAHLRGGELDGVRILSAASVAAMQAPQRSNGGKALPMGLGWHLGEAGGERYVTHPGGGGGYKAEIRIYPALGYAVAVAANETSFDTAPLARTVVLLRPPPLPVSPPAGG